MSSGSLSVLLVQLLLFWRHCDAYSSGILLSKETDRLALLSFKSRISADPFGALSSWNDSMHFCKWYGVSCSKRHNGRVTALKLTSEGLSGSISPHIGNLSFLKVLHLYNNSFLRGIPREIGRLRRLQELVLYNNSLGGEIPSNISGCLALTMFRVGRNNLVGGLPWQFGELNKLQLFMIATNNLKGTIPPSFGNLSSLQVFVGSRNQFSGRIPNTLGQLKRIQKLGLDSNSLSGEIPASIFNLSSLRELWFGANELHGTLPWNLGISLPYLENFDVGRNQFTGNVPSSLSNASNLVLLQLGRNKFTGSMPNMASSSKLWEIRMINSSLGSGKPNDLEFLSSLTNATSLEYIAVDGNNFGGSLPQHIGNLSTSLKHLSFSNNKVSGNIPSGIQYLVNLEELSASNNNLSGTIAYSIGRLKSLERLLLSNNQFSGYIPSSVGNLTKLIELDISTNNLHGEIPTSIRSCNKLLGLKMSRNNLNGVIPPQVLSLTSLSIVLDLSRNRFTGALPVEVGKLKNLGILTLSHNRLSGNIPSSLGSCISLESLFLQGNHLQGVIPSSLSSLRGIQEMDLSSNNLSGQIPTFLEGMNISKLLNLSNNNFDGEMPERGVFKNASIISVIGNNKLCGRMGALKLRPCNFTRHSNKALSFKWKIVISTICGLLVLTSVGSCFFIFFIKNRGSQDTFSTHDVDLPHLSYQRLFKATNGFSRENQIGVGSFGTVYKGGLLNQIDESSINIAVKVFNLQRHGALKSFISECEALKNIRHKNLVRIITVCSSVDHEGNDFKALIYELSTNGSLEDWLHHPIERINESATRSLKFIEMVNIAIDIASAMDYLHDHCETSIVHCDLKPSNILLDEDMVAHVGDFGLARFLSIVTNSSSNSTEIKGTVGYTAPEYGMGNEVSVQGDVYSYGVLLLEMFTGRRPTDESFKDGASLRNIVKNALLKQHTLGVVDPILLNELLRKAHRNFTTSRSDEKKNGLEELMSSIFEIGVTCSSNIPEERLSMSEVLSKLIVIKKKELVQSTER